MDFFKKKDDNSTHEEKPISLMDKLSEQEKTLNLFDFNPEYLNMYFLKCINSYLESRYWLDISKGGIYLSENCKEQISVDIAKYKLYSENLNVRIELLSADLIRQDIQSINYISDLLMNITVRIHYYSQNIYNKLQTYKEEYFSQNIWFHFENNGWVVEKYFERNFL